MYEMILTQKQKIKQEKERRERLAEAERAANLDAALKEEQKKLDEFERTQSSMLGSRETESKKRKIDELSSFWVVSQFQYYYPNDGRDIHQRISMFLAI